MQTRSPRQWEGTEIRVFTALLSGILLGFAVARYRYSKKVHMSAIRAPDWKSALIDLERVRLGVLCQTYPLCAILLVLRLPEAPSEP